MPYATTPFDVVAGSYYFLRAAVFADRSAPCVCVDESGTLYLQSYGASGAFGPKWSLESVSYRSPFRLYGPGTQQNADDFIAGTFTEANVTALGEIELPASMVWRGPWDGGVYTRGDVTLDGAWLMAANKATSERPAPQRTGTQDWVSDLAGGLPPWGFSQTSQTQVIVGQRYTYPSAMFTDRLRYWIHYDPNVTYEVWLVEDPTGTPRYENIVAAFTPDPESQDQWLEFGLGGSLVAPGSVFDVLLVIRANLGGSTWQADWLYTRGNGDPVSGEARHQNAGGGAELRIHQEDDGGTNRDASLSTIAPGDRIAAGGMEWDVLDAEKISGTVYSFAVSPSAQAPAPAVYTFTFTTATPTPITYDYVMGFYSGEAQVDGVFTMGAYPDDVTLNDHAYGVDLQIQPALASEDWDPLAVSSGAAGGGSGGAASPLLVASGNATNPGQSHPTTSWADAHNGDPFMTLSGLDASATYRLVLHGSEYYRMQAAGYWNTHIEFRYRLDKPTAGTSDTGPESRSRDDERSGNWGNGGNAAVGAVFEFTGETAVTVYSQVVRGTIDLWSSEVNRGTLSYQLWRMP